MPDGTLMHAALKIGDSIVMLADVFPGSDMKAPSQLSTTTMVLHVYSKDVDALFARAVAAGAKVAMPLEDQFWGERLGKLVDPFGHHWSASMQVRMSRAERETKRQEAMVMFEKGEHPGTEGD